MIDNMDAKELLEELQKDLADLFILNGKMTSSELPKKFQLERARQKALLLIMAYDELSGMLGYAVPEKHLQLEMQLAEHRGGEVQQVQQHLAAASTLQQTKEKAEILVQEQVQQVAQTVQQREDVLELESTEDETPEIEEQEKEPEDLIEDVEEIQLNLTPGVPIESEGSEEIPAAATPPPARNEVEQSRMKDLNLSGILEAPVEGDMRLEYELDNYQKKVNSLDELLQASKAESPMGAPIRRLIEAIGLTDRFEYIADLFDNRTDVFYHTVQNIDQMSSFNDAERMLRSNFNWPDSEIKKQFMDLVYRRFL